MNEKRVWNGVVNTLSFHIEEQVTYLRRVHEEEIEMLERHVDGLKEKIERLERRLEEEK